jgi:hypothetical protein
MKLNKFTDDMRIISKLSDNPTETAAELKEKFDEGNVKTQIFINAMIDSMLDAIWPVGSVYISVNDNNPEVVFGGVWEKIENAFLLGASSAHPLGSSGGAETHALSVEEMPQHSHNIWGGTEVSSLNVYGFALTSDHLTSQYATIGAGEGKPHDNMPPYLAVGIWKRIK